MKSCDFCKIVRGEEPATIVGETATTLAFFPLHPASLGHTLIIPKKHFEDFLALDAQTAADLAVTTVKAGNALKQVLAPDGINLISSAGRAASQTILHVHYHLVPRQEGDRMGHIWPPPDPVLDRLEDGIAERVSQAFDTFGL